MIKRLTFSLSLLFVLVTTTSFVFKYYNGIPGYTGSPGESTCTSCHAQAASSGSISMSASPAFVAGKFIPGQTYTISIILKHPTLIEFGIDCEIVNGTSTAAVDAGYIYAILNQGTSAPYNPGNGRKNIIHGTPSAGTGIGPFTKVFKFQWIAPISGPAIIYAAGIAVNGNDDPTGDYTKTGFWSLTPGSATSVIPLNNELLTLSVYPNPAFSDVTIEYSLLHGGVLKGVLYNLQGKELSVLFNDYQTPGANSKTVLLSEDIGSGVYLLKLSLNGKEISEKMIIKQ